MKTLVVLTMIVGQAVGFPTTSRGAGLLCSQLKNMRLSIRVPRRLFQSQSDPPETPEWSKSMVDDEGEEGNSEEEKSPTKFTLELFIVISVGLAIVGRIGLNVVADIDSILQAIKFLSVSVVSALFISPFLIPKEGKGGGAGIFFVVLPAFAAVTYVPFLIMYYLFK